MGGNLYEWCEDLYALHTEDRVLRGGSWKDFEPANLLSSYRAHATPGGRLSNYGFRVVLVGRTGR